MVIAIASDHHGVDIKKKIVKYLSKKGYDLIDLSPDCHKVVDYPIYAKSVGHSIINGEAEYGILICATGIGMSIACNRIKGIRCARVSNADDIKHAREDNDANVVSFGSNLKMYEIYDILDAFLQTKFSGKERHIRRIKLIDEDQDD